MQVILLENVQNLGVLGDTVKVRPGYARNFLIPHGKAVAATPANVAEFEARRAELERQQGEIIAAARTRAEAIDGLEITIAQKAGEEGKLFGSVGTVDIAESITAAGHEVARAEVRLPGDAIRQVGEHPIVIHLHTEVEANVMLHVIPEK